MSLPDAITDRLPFLDALENDWQPVARWALVAWLIFYLLFLYQALRGQGSLLMIDLVFVPVHEGGHLLFRFLGQWISIAGGTFLQLFAPFALAVYFALQRHVTGTAFCAFFFFEQFLPIATYMADARAQALPLLTVGDAEYVIHDWNYLFCEPRRSQSRHGNRRHRSRPRLARHVRHCCMADLPLPRDLEFAGSQLANSKLIRAAYDVRVLSQLSTINSPPSAP